MQKIAIQYGRTSIAVETSDGEALPILKATFDLLEERKPGAVMLIEDDEPTATPSHERPPVLGLREGTINVVCAKLGSASCRDLLVAAAAHLLLYQGKGRWTREEWVNTAKTANDWKLEYSSQVARDVGRLIKSGKMIENSADVFSLSRAEADQLKIKVEAHS